MSDDTILEEIHRIRAELSDQFGGDMHALGQYLRELDANSGIPTVTRSPKPVRMPVPNKKRGGAERSLENAGAKVPGVSAAQ